MKPARALSESLDWRGPDALSGPLAAAEDALARLDERLRASPIRDGWVSRTHFQDACASLWLAGELVCLEDLVLRDARMDIRSPTHELTRAQAALRIRRQIAGAAPDWVLSPDGLSALRGDGEGATAEAQRGGQGREGQEDDPGDIDEGEKDGGDPLADELAALDRALESSAKILSSGEARARPLRDPLIYDPDFEEGDRLEAWRSAAAAARSEPALLAAALLWDAWETNPPLERQAWLGNLLIPAILRARQKTRSHLFCLNSALRLVKRENRRSSDRATRLAAFLEAIAGGAEAGMKDHDRWLLVRRSLEGKLKGRRSSSRLPALVELILARPIASAGMIAGELGVRDLGLLIGVEPGRRDPTHPGPPRARHAERKSRLPSILSGSRSAPARRPDSQACIICSSFPRTHPRTARNPGATSRA